MASGPTYHLVFQRLTNTYKTLAINRHLSLAGKINQQIRSNPALVERRLGLEVNQINSVQIKFSGVK